MKQIFSFLLLFSFATKCFSISDKIRLGLQFSPGIAWSKPFGSEIKEGKPRFGANYGFMIEYWFAKNYGFTSGLNGAYDGCNISGRVAFEENANHVKVRSVTEHYVFSYIEIPAYLKLKTNDIKGGKFSVWGQVGFNINLTVSARATYSDSIPTPNENIFIDKENVLKQKNAVAQSIPGFWTNFFDIRIGAGGGFEYRFDSRTSLIAGLMYHNGFINNIFDHDPNKNPNVMRMMSLRIGVLF